jgi:hypothetical protein
VELLPFLKIIISINTTFYRARKCENKENKDKYTPEEMGKPSIGKAKSGRLNPEGIPYLYLGSTHETVIYEVKPTLGNYVVVCEYCTLKELTLVDLRDPKIASPFDYGDDLVFILRHIQFLRRLGYELSKPVFNDEDKLKYIPCQFLAEAIKDMGYDGIIYKSSFAEGYNIVVFDDNLKFTKKEITKYHIYGLKYNYKKVNIK